MANGVSIRGALTSERAALEALQLRASLTNAGDREFVLAHPDAIELPTEQIAEGHVFVAEMDGGVAGFAAVLLRPDGQIELDGLFVEPSLQRRGIGRMLVEYCVTYALQRDGSFCTSSAIRMRKRSTPRAVSPAQTRRRRASARD